MATHLQKTMEDKLYRNWVKGGLAHKYTKDGIQRFVDAEVQTFQQRILTDSCQVKGLPAKTICNSCSTHSVLNKHCLCRCHGLCEEIRDQIVKHHRYCKKSPYGSIIGPSWKNSDAQLWFSNSWEVAKCYMAASGYSGANSAADTDLPGLLSVVINLTDFQNSLTENLSNPDNLFCQAKTIRNEILHTSTFQLSDTKLNDYVDVMIQLLSAPTHLAADNDAQDAINQLAQIKNGPLVVTDEDERKMRAESLQAIKEGTDDAIQAIQAEGSEQVGQLNKNKDDAIQAIQAEGSEQVGQLNKNKDDAIQAIQAEGSEQVGQLNKNKDDALQAIQAEGSEQVGQLNKNKDNALQAIQAEGSEHVGQLNKKKDDALQAIQAEGSEHVGQLNKKKDDALQYIQAEGSEQVGQLDKKKDDALQAIQAEGSEHVGQLNKNKDNALQAIQAEGSEQVGQLDNKKDDAIQAIQAESREHLRQLEKKKDNIQKEIQAEGSKQVGQVEEKKDDALKAIKRKSSEQLRQFEEKVGVTLNAIETKGSEQKKRKVEQANEAEQAYIKAKKDLQTDLIKLYQEDYLKESLCPLMPENKDTDIADLYVKPRMRQVDPQTCQKEGGKKVESYKDIFYKDSQQCKRIYISADAGMGKTTLCLRMISTWCRAHSENARSDQLSDDEQAMLNFQFLFYISLRDASDENNIETMIKNQLPVEHNLASKLLQKESEKCLILLDGLDEWSAPKDHKSTPNVNKGLPGRPVMTNLTIITTSRSWKIEVLRLKTTEIHNQIELTGLDADSSIEFVGSVVAILNTRRGREMKIDDFFSTILHHKLWQFFTIPLILKQLIYMWYEGKPLGKSQCDIYSGIINLLFELAEEKLADNLELAKIKERTTKSLIQLPKCFEGKTKCQEYGYLVYSLSRLSFETLFSQKPESSLVFESTVAELYGLSKTEIDVCLKVGILTQRKVVKGCTSRMKSLSFLHKTFQEFLASLFVALSPCPTDELVKIICNVCNSVDKVLEMSKVFLFVSGMSPEFAYRLTEYITDVTSEVKQEYRQTCCFRREIYNMSYKLEDSPSRSILECIQDIIIGCVEESSNNCDEYISLKLEDIFLYNDGLDEAEISTTMHHLICANSENIKSIHIDAVDTDFLESISKLLSLQKITINIWSNDISLNTIYPVLCLSKDTLIALELYTNLCRVLHNMSEMSLEQFSTMLPNVNNLKVLALEGFELTLPQYDHLLAFVSQATQLTHIFMEHLTCTASGMDCDIYHHNTTVAKIHKLDLSHHNQLQYLYIRLSDVTIANVNPTKLECCVISVLPCDMGSTFSSLKEMQNLTVLHLYNKTYIGMSIKTYSLSTNKSDVVIYCRLNDDKDVDTLLPCLLTPLVDLTEIAFCGIDFGDKNELKFSQEVKYLESVTICDVQMTNKALSSFMNSLPINVKTLNMTDVTIDSPISEGEVQVLAKMENLESATLENVKMTSHSFTRLWSRMTNIRTLVLKNLKVEVQVLPKMENLENLSIRSMSECTLLVCVFNSIPQIQTILLDGYFQARSPLTIQLSQDMKNLKSVEIRHRSMTYEGLRSFVDSIPETQHSVEVELFNIAIPPAEAASTLDYITSCPRFAVTKCGRSFLAMGNDINFHTVITGITDDTQ